MRSSKTTKIVSSPSRNILSPQLSFSEDSNLTYHSIEDKRESSAAQTSSQQLITTVSRLQRVINENDNDLSKDFCIQAGDCIRGDDDDIVYEDIGIEEFEYDPHTLFFFYPCPCGDLFEVEAEALLMISNTKNYAKETSNLLLCNAGKEENRQIDSKKSTDNHRGKGNIIQEETLHAIASCPSCTLKVRVNFTYSRLKIILDRAGNYRQEG